MKRPGLAGRCRSVPDMDEREGARVPERPEGFRLVLPRDVRRLIGMIRDERLAGSVETRHHGRVVEEIPVAAVAVVRAPDAIEDQVADLEFARRLPELTDAAVQGEIPQELVHLPPAPAAAPPGAALGVPPALVLRPAAVLHRDAALPEDLRSEIRTVRRGAVPGGTVRQ